MAPQWEQLAVVVAGEEEDGGEGGEEDAHRAADDARGVGGVQAELLHQHHQGHMAGSHPLAVQLPQPLERCPCGAWWTKTAPGTEDNRDRRTG